MHGDGRAVATVDHMHEIRGPWHSRPCYHMIQPFPRTGKNGCIAWKRVDGSGVQ